MGLGLGSLGLPSSETLSRSLFSQAATRPRDRQGRKAAAVAEAEKLLAEAKAMVRPRGYQD